MSKRYLFIAACALVLIGLIGVVVAATPTPTPTPITQYYYVLKWGSQGSGDGEFVEPSDVAMDSDGNVYVAERGNNRIQKFTSDGVFITKWSGGHTGDEYPFDPISIAVDALGDVYVAEANNHRVQKFNSTGGFITKWGTYGSGDGQFSAPEGIAVDGAGNVYVTENSNDRVQKFNSTGGFITKWGGVEGSEDGQFFDPRGIGVDRAGNVYVIDESDPRVQKFTSNGDFLSKWGSSGSGEGQFAGPTDLFVDAAGNIFIADTNNARVQKFAPTGAFITKWGSGGRGIGQFAGPNGIAVDGTGNVYVADTGNHRVQKFAPGAPPPTPTVTVTVTPSPGSPYKSLSIPGRIEAEDYNTGGEGIAYHDTTAGNAGGAYRTDDVDIESIAAEGSPNVAWVRNGEWLVYTVNVTQTGTYTLKARVASPNSGRQAVLSVDGAHTATINVPNTGSFLSYTNVTVPVMLTVGTHVLKLTFVGDGQNINWLEFTTGAPPPAEQYHYVMQWGSFGSGDGQFTAPFSIATDPSGNVYVTDSSLNRVQKFTSNGGFITKWGSEGTGDGQFREPMGIAVDGAGNVYVVDKNNLRVQKFTPTGTFVTKWGNPGSGDGEFEYPTGVAVDRDNNVYVTDVVNNQVQKFTSTGGFIARWGTGGTGDGQLNEPGAIAVDGAGKVYVADSNRVQKFTSDGMFVSSLGSFYIPSGVAADGAGNVFVAVMGDNQIRMLTPDGGLVTQWGTWGGGNGQFSSPNGVAVDGAGNVYVTDLGTGRIQKFAPGASTPTPTVTPYPTSATPYKPLVVPGRVEAEDYNTGGQGVAYHDTTVGNSGGAYRADDVDIEYAATEGSHAVGWIRNSEWLTYTVNVTQPGEYTMLARVASPSAGRKASLAIDGVSAGTVAVPNTGSFVTYTTVTVPLVLTTGTHVLKISFSGDGQNLNWLEFVQGTVTPTPTQPAPGEQYRFVMKWGDTGSEVGEFSWPQGVALDSAGYLYVADEANHRVQKFAPNGAFAMKLGWDSWGREDGQLDHPMDVAVDGTGTIYVADTGNARVQKFAPTGAFISKWGSEGSDDGYFSSPQGIVVDGAGTVYVTDGNGRVQMFTSNGSFIGAWGEYGTEDGQFNYPTAIAVDGDGNVYVVDEGNQRVQKFTSFGVFITKWGSQGSGDGEFYNPSEIAVDAAGYVYVTDTYNHRVQKFTSNGAFVTKWGSLGSGDGQFGTEELGGPTGIAVDGAGNVFVAETGNDRIQVFAPLAATPTPTPTVTVTPTPGGPYRPLSIPGRIEAEDYNLGGEGIAYHDTTKGNSGGVYRTDDVDIERFTAESSPSVGWIRNGEWLTYTADVTTSGAYTMKARVANPNVPRTAVLSVDGVQAATITVPTTGSYGTFTTISVPVTLSAGTHTLRLTFSSDGQNLNWLEFATGTVTTPTPTPTPGAGGASFVAVPMTAPHGSAVKFTVTPATGKSIGAAWWSFDATAHLNTWNSRAVSPTFYYPSAGTFSPLVKLTYTDGSTETVQRTGYIRAT